METLSHLALGFSVAMTAQNLLFCLLGAVMGTVIGVLPGIGPLATISMLLPLTLGLDPTSSLIMLAGIYYGAQYGGSTTAILLNLPGEASSAVTTIDGYQMALQGRAGPALATAALGSFFAGCTATVLIAMIAGPLTYLALQFGPADYFSLLIVGLVSSIALASGSTLKALSMICLGLLLGLTGTDIFSGTPRFTFGNDNLLDGLDFVAIAVGLFGVSEILKNLETVDVKRSVSPVVGRLWPSTDDLKRITKPILRGTFIGSLLGILPGGGALLASFVSYTVEKRISPNAKQFGRGAIEGVAAPESANNAAAQTSFVPMLALGVPSNVSMALMMGALIVQGITPGPTVIARNPDLFWGLIASMWIGNAMLVILNLPLVGIWTSLLKIPYTILFPAIVMFCCIGVYSVDGSSFSVVLIAAAALSGYVLTRLGYELAPFTLGFILGPMLETYLRRAMIIADGDPTIFISSPLSAAFLIIAVVMLIAITLPAFSKKRDEVFIPED